MSKLGPYVMGLVAATLVIGFLMPNSQCRNSVPGMGPQKVSVDTSEVVFKAGNFTVYGQDLAETIQIEESNRLAQAAGGEFTPFDIVDARVAAVDRWLNTAALVSLAKKEGIAWKIEEVADFLLESVDGEIQQQLDMIGFQLQFQKQFLQQNVENLKKTKGEKSKEYLDAKKQLDEMAAMTSEAVYQQQYGVTPAEAKTRLREQVENSRGNEVFLRSNLAGFLQSRLDGHYKSRVDASDEALKKSYNRYTFQQLLISSEKNPTPKVKADEVMKRIKAGMTFEQAVKQYSDREPSKDQKPEQAGVETQDWTQLTVSNMDYVLKLKPGEISDVVELPAGAAIYKLIKIEEGTVPDSLDAKKARIDVLKSQLGGKLMQDALDAELKSLKVEWTDNFLEQVHKYKEVRTGEISKELAGGANRDKRVAMYREILNALVESETTDSMGLSALRYVVFDQIDAETPPGPKKEALKKEKLALYKEISPEVDTYAFRFEYAELLIGEKLGDEALEQLKEISEKITADEVNETVRAHVLRVQKLLATASNHAKKDNPTIKAIQTDLDEWFAMEADVKKQEEEWKKADEEEAKKAAEESKKSEQQPSANEKPAEKPAAKGTGG